MHSGSLFLMLFPLLQFNGQGVSVLSPLVNVLAIPFIAGLMVPVALLSVVVSVLSQTLFELLLWLQGCLMSFFLQGLNWLDQPATIGWWFLQAGRV